MINLKSYTLRNFRDIPQLKKLHKQQLDDIEVLGNVLPFRTNNYVIDELIDWDNFEEDPFFILTFPQKEMLNTTQYSKVSEALKKQLPRNELSAVVDKIRLSLNPNPNKQEENVPCLDGENMRGLQHKYNETVLCFPSQGQTCHAYCTFCFRWPQFTMQEFKFSMRDPQNLVRYLRRNKQVTDVLFTGGDPMTMSASVLDKYFDLILESRSELQHIQNIRIGTKALTYWPYRFTEDADAGSLLKSFEKLINAGLAVSIMAHVNHPGALKTKAVQQAICNIRNTGATIRTQSPIMKHINDKPGLWSEMWKQQVSLGLVPYYMFIARDTGAQDYFSVSLDDAHTIFAEAYSNVSGLARTVRGPSMSCKWGKICIKGKVEINDEMFFVLEFLQGRDKNWVGKPFFAKYNPDAVWISDLQVALGKEKFFFED
ncbi:MAG: KamA family radical SAM protein [Bacteroidales bacterium]